MLARGSGRVQLAILCLATALLAAALLATGGAAGEPLWPVPERPVYAGLVHNAAAMLYDDGCYYLGIARRMANGLGSTFDGRHPTNGYHPLWLLLLVPLAAVLASAPALALGVFVLETVLAAATAALVWRSTARLIRGPGAFLAALVWIRIQAVYWSPWSGLEYALQALLTAALLDRWLALTLAGRAELGARRARGDRKAVRRSAGLGLLAALAFLARLDNALLALFVGAGVARRWGGRALAAFSLPVSLAAVSYAVVNVAGFGHPLPVSGAVKRAWSAALLAADPRYLEEGWVGAKLRYLLWPAEHLSRGFVLALSIALVAAAAIVTIAAARRTEPWRALLPAAAFALAQVAIYAGAYHGGYSFQPWHFALQPWLAAVAVGGVFGAATKRWLPSTAATVAAAAVSLLLAASTVHALDTRRDRLRAFGRQPLAAAAVWARDHVEPGAAVGAWNAGLIALVSGRTVINLDGLVSSWSFFRSHRHDLCGYLETEGIDLVLDVFPPGRGAERLPNALAACRHRFAQVWAGPSYGPGRDAAAAFRRRPELVP